jgi:hypothetical protein
MTFDNINIMTFDNITEAWNFLISFQHKRYTVGPITYFQWVFYDGDKNVYKLEHQAGIIRRFIINKWFLLKNYNENCIVYDILNVINYHKQDIENTQLYFNKNEMLIQHIIDILGKCTNFIEQTMIWNMKFEKIELVIKIHMYMDNENEKNISFSIKENNKDWKQTKVDKNQITNFLEKNKSKFKLKSKKINTEIDNEIVNKIEKISLKRSNIESDDTLVEKFSKVKLSGDTQDMSKIDMSKVYSDISNTYKQLFIKMSKEKRYQIQSCKKF